MRWDEIVSLHSLIRLVQVGNAGSSLKTNSVPPCIKWIRDSGECCLRLWMDLSLFDVIDVLRMRSGLSDLICMCLTWLDLIVNFDVSRFFCNWVVMNLWSSDHVFVCWFCSVLNWTFLRYVIRSWLCLVWFDLAADFEISSFYDQSSADCVWFSLIRLFVLKKFSFFIFDVHLSGCW